MIKMKGEPKMKIEDLGELLAVVRGDALDLNILKSKQSTKPLICHFYESAYTAQCLLNGYLNSLLTNISDAMNEDVNNVRNIILFFTFLHDVGKIHPAFQFKLIPEVLNDFGYEKQSIYDGFRHEVYSEKILSKYINNRFGKLHNRNLISMMPKAIKCHHQGKNPITCPILEKEDLWVEMQDEVINIAHSLFPFEVPTTNLRELGNGIFELVVGIINLADWMASTQNVYDDKTPDDFKSQQAYINHLITQCELFLKQNFMNKMSLYDRFKQFDDAWPLLIGEFSPRPMQKTVESLVESKKESSLLFIEDSCGGGKTEAAMYYALSQVQNAEGVYFALPTTATSENMRQRISEICKKGIGDNFKVPVYNSMAWMQDDDVQLDNNLWQNDAKLKLFYPIAVGTVDQLLMAVQGVKYSDLGLIALSNKVLIIDEMHAYDAYMLEELKTLFSYCSLMSVTIIVLSATMTSDTKKQLIEAYNIVKQSDKISLNNKETTYQDLVLSMDYPLITKVTKQKITELKSPVSKSTQYKYEFLKIDDKQCFEKVWNKAYGLIHEEGTLAIVFNTIAQAINMYTYARKQIEDAHLDIDLDLLHSRFSLESKSNKTQNILKKYGKNRDSRPTKSILISTQIIEQSLDVDFDYMITEIAPIDLIIQRLGRVRRHDDKGTRREKFGSDDVSTFIFYQANGFGKSKYVYEENILQATCQVLDKKTILESPTDIRDLIEEVYFEENINKLKTMRQSQQANLISIGKVDSNIFWRVNNMSSLGNDLHTRQENVPSTNIIIVTPEQRCKLENGTPLTNSERKEIIKTQMYSSVALKKLEGLPRIECDDAYLNEYNIFIQDVMNVSEELGLII